MNIVYVEKVSKEYQLGATVVKALKGVDLAVEGGEFMAIVGPSGSGKSTLLNLIGCIEKPTAGIVKVDGVDVVNLSSNELAVIRAGKLGFIFQTFNLLPVLTVAENVEYPLHLKPVGSKEKKERVDSVLKEVGLERFSAHKPAELSGGQRQRVAIARALVGSPSIILADEPTANLDHKTGTGILELMRGINKKFGTTFIFSTHDQKIVTMADRVVELRDGERAGD
ncbi:MAG: ABC transporter ATP-binding protein [Deltaproteobacteria bacterium]|nr:ABC transporter ATP-binding protein [Deltaproteobacteria bacterium]